MFFKPSGAQVTLRRFCTSALLLHVISLNQKEILL